MLYHYYEFELEVIAVYYYYDHHVLRNIDDSTRDPGDVELCKRSFAMTEKVLSFPSLKLNFAVKGVSQVSEYAAIVVVSCAERKDRNYSQALWWKLFANISAWRDLEIGSC